MSCIFCKIVSNKIETKKIYEDEHVIAFNDINPVSPTHILVIPKKHIESTNFVNKDNSWVISKVFEVISKLSDDGLFKGGEYRVVCNCGEGAGQTVGHLHFHVISGRDMRWPPG